MTAPWLVPLPVMIPLITAGITLALWRWPTAQRLLAIVALASNTVVGAVLMVLTDSSGQLVVHVGGWRPQIGITLVVDRLSALMVMVSGAVLLAVLLYSLGQDIADGAAEAPVSVYYPTYLVLAAGVSNAFITGDLFNLYVGFEILLAASYVLLTMGGTRERIRAGSTYVVVSLLSSIIFLAALALIYAATGTVNLAELAVRLPQVADGPRLALQVMLLTAFGIKAAVFPLSAWLPDSYPTAPAPVTAVFAGLLTKVGVYAIIRTQTLLFTDGRLNSVLLVLALATMLVGILGAVAQSDIKRLLSFTLVSHIGYMIMGIGLATEMSMMATVYYVVHHITAQTTLFLVVGLIERKGGTTSLDLLGGLAKAAPGLAVMFFLPAMSLAGIPPLSGFLGKLGLVEAGVAEGGTLPWILVVGAIVTSLLTLYAIVKAWNKAFWQPAADPVPADPLPRAMVFPTAALVIAGLCLTLFAGPLFAYAHRTAIELSDVAGYGAAVVAPAAGDMPSDAPAGGDE